MGRSVSNGNIGVWAFAPCRSKWEGKKHILRVTSGKKTNKKKTLEKHWSKGRPNNSGGGEGREPVSTVTSQGTDF